MRNLFLNELILSMFFFQRRAYFRVYCVPGQSSYNSIVMVYIERWDGVSCSVYDTLHTDAKGYIITCKLVKLAFCLCGEPIDPSNVGFAVGTRQLILQHSLNC